MARRQSSIQKQINRATGANRSANQSKFGRMSTRRNPKTGNWIASGSAQGFTNSATGKLSAGGQMLSRRQRYYQVRTGLGLSGG